MSSDVIIELRNVVKNYQIGTVTIPALRGISFKLKKGHMYSIIGPSGSGKTTLMRLIGCLDLPTSGTLLLDGTDISELSEDELAEIRGRKIGFVFQLFNLIPTLTAAENVELPMTFQGIPPEERKERVKEMLGIVGVLGRAEHKPSELSGGQQQRVAIARALVMDPPLILADEPTGNLDSKTGAEIMALFSRLHDEKKKTIVLVTHDPYIAKYARETIKIKDGRVIGVDYNHK